MGLFDSTTATQNTSGVPNSPLFNTGQTTPTPNPYGTNPFM